MDSERFTDLYAAVETLRQELAVAANIGENVPEKVSVQLDLNVVASHLIGIVFELTRCVAELEGAVRD